jgi:hypothetical protein
MLNEVGLQNSDIFPQIKDLAGHILKENEKTVQGAVYVDHFNRILTGGLSDKAYWDVRVGWEENGVRFEGTEDMAFNNADEWGFEKTLKFMKAWDLLIPISQAFLELPISRKAGELKIGLKEALSSAGFAFQMFQRSLDGRNLALATAQIDFAKRNGHDLLSALMCKRLEESGLLADFPEVREHVIKTMAKSLGSLTSWFTYNEYTNSAMAETDWTEHEDPIPSE